MWWKLIWLWSHGQHFLKLKGMIACLQAYGNDPEKNDLEEIEGGGAIFKKEFSDR